VKREKKKNLFFKRVDFFYAKLSPRKVISFVWRYKTNIWLKILV